MSGLLGGAPGDMEQRLLHADYHGAMLTVSRAADARWAGRAGIVAKVTANTFQLVSADDRLHGGRGLHDLIGADDYYRL